MVLAYYIHKLQPFLIRFGDNFGIRYYGVAYALGFLIAGFLLHLYYKRGRSPLNPDAQFDLLFWIIVGTMVGGRLGYFLFYAPETLVHEPLAIFRVWDGGMASHGGFIGVILGLWWAAHRQRVSVLTVGDLVATLAPPGLMLGRIANFINGELWGKISHVPWAVIFRQSAPAGTPVELIPPRHPSQLYEAALEGLALTLYTQWRIWRTPDVLQKPGRLAGEFLLGYAIARVVCEFFRQNDAGIPPVLGLNRGAWLSLLVAAAGMVLIVRSCLRGSTAAPASAEAAGKPPEAGAENPHGRRK